jgi:hypothetical protein
MPDILRYNDIQQRAIHNAYDKQEQLLDQIIRYRVRCLELDLHAWGDGSGGYTAICPSQPEWFIYHSVGLPVGRNVLTLGDALRLLRAFHDANPKHEVFTLHLELKARHVSADSTFLCYTPDDLDWKIMDGLDRSNLFTPADLLAANPGAGSLFHAAGNMDMGGASPAAKWPSLEELRGKFIVVIHGHNYLPGIFRPEIDDYANAANANARIGFIMREDLWNDNDLILANKHIIFHGEVSGSSAKQLRIDYPGLILRGSHSNDEQSFRDRQSEGCQIILTDCVDFHRFPFVRTHNDRLFPFGRALFDGPSAWADPSVAERSEGGTLYVLATYSEDLWGTEDRFSFAYSPDLAPAFDTWTAVVANTSNDSVDDWGKGALMARASLSPSAPYFAVGRTADSHGLFIQYRSPGCGDPPNSVPCGTAQDRLGNRDNIGDSNIQFIRLDVERRSDGSSLCRGYGSIDGSNWYQIGSDVTLAIDLPYRGMAASSLRSRNPDGTPEGFFFQSLRRNNRSLAGHKFVIVSVNDGTSEVITELTEYSASLDDTGLWLFTSTGNQFQLSNPWRSGVGNWNWQRSKIVAGDFDGDGKDELAVLYDYSLLGNPDDTGLWLFTSTGDQFQLSNPWRSGVGNWNWGRAQIVAGDFDGDGKDELAALYDYSLPGNPDDTGLWLFTSTGNQFQLDSPWRSGVGNWNWQRSKIVTGNFDGDGKDELAALYDYSSA